MTGRDDRQADRTSWPLRSLRTLWPQLADDTRIFVFIIIAAGLLIIAVILATVLAVVAVSVARASHKRILSAHKFTSFVNFGEAPLS